MSDGSGSELESIWNEKLLHKQIINGFDADFELVVWRILFSGQHDIGTVIEGCVSCL